MCINVKLCSKCKLKKPLEDYYKNKRFIFGVHAWCKKCLIKNASDYSKTHKEKCKARTKLWRQNNLERSRELVRKWHSEHKDYMKNWRAAHKERISFLVKRWRDRQKEIKQSETISSSTDPFCKS